MPPISFTSHLAALRLAAARLPAAAASSPSTHHAPHLYKYRALRTSAPPRSAVKPGATEQSTADGPTHEQVAGSDAAYDAGKTRPEEAGAQIEEESGAPLRSRGAAGRGPSSAAEAGERGPSPRAESGNKKPSRMDSGGSRARKNQGQQQGEE